MSYFGDVDNLDRHSERIEISYHNNLGLLQTFANYIVSSQRNTPEAGVTKIGGNVGELSNADLTEKVLKFRDQLAYLLSRDEEVWGTHSLKILKRSRLEYMDANPLHRLSILQTYLAIKGSDINSHENFGLVALFTDYTEG